MTNEEIHAAAMAPIDSLHMVLHCSAERAGFASIAEYLVHSSESQEGQRRMCAMLISEMRELGFIFKRGKWQIWKI